MLCVVPLTGPSRRLQRADWGRLSQAPLAGTNMGTVVVRSSREEEGGCNPWVSARLEGYFERLLG